MFSALAAVGLFLMQAGPAADVAKPAAPAVAASTAKPPKPKKICTSQAVTGSIMPVRICRTPEQMAADERAAKRALDSTQRQ